MHLLDLYNALRGSSIPEPLFVAMASTGTLTLGLHVLDLGLQAITNLEQQEQCRVQGFRSSGMGLRFTVNPLAQAGLPPLKKF